jgi:hypothetical protein
VLMDEVSGVDTDKRLVRLILAFLTKRRQVRVFSRQN